MKISVIMATYNGEKYIREQLLSILSQTVLPDEIIIGDDCSRDGTVAAIEEIRDTHPEGKRILLQKNSENLGYRKNFYSLMKEAGTGIVFLSDQDDIWEPDKISVMAGLLETGPEILSLSAGFSVIDENGDTLIPGRGNGKLKEIKKTDFLRYPHYPGMSMAVRGELLPAVLERFAGTKTAHDWAVNYTASSKGGMYMINVPLTRYRRHGGNVSGMTALEKTGAAGKRAGLVKELIESISSSGDPELSEMAAFESKRLQLINEGKAVPLFLYSIINYRYTRLRPILGDMAALWKK